jgi:hypothetical protein
VVQGGILRRVGNLVGNPPGRLSDIGEADCTIGREFTIRPTSNVKML